MTPEPPRPAPPATAPSVRGWPTRIVVAAVAAATTVLLGYAVDAAAGSAEAADALGPGEVVVTLDVEHSRFAPAELRVRAGTLVRFVVVNADPIPHELVIGPAAVHRAHERGTEAVHPPVPGEVSVEPNGTGMTFYRFEEPGTVEFACHLPGHRAYGMVGEVHVTG